MPDDSMLGASPIAQAATGAQMPDLPMPDTQEDPQQSLTDAMTAQKAMQQQQLFNSLGGVSGGDMMSTVAAGSYLNQHPELQNMLGQAIDAQGKRAMANMMQAGSPMGKLSEAMGNVGAGLGLIFGGGAPNAIQNAVSYVNSAKQQQQMNQQKAADSLKNLTQLINVTGSAQITKNALAASKQASANALAMMKMQGQDALKNRGLDISDKRANAYMDHLKAADTNQAQHNKDYEQRTANMDKNAVAHQQYLTDIVAPIRKQMADALTMRAQATSSLDAAKTPAEYARALASLQNANTNAKAVNDRLITATMRANLLGQGLATQVDPKTGQPTHMMTDPDTGKLVPLDFNPLELPPALTDEEEAGRDFKGVGSSYEQSLIKQITGGMQQSMQGQAPQAAQGGQKPVMQIGNKPYQVNIAKLNQIYEDQIRQAKLPGAKEAALARFKVLSGGQLPASMQTQVANQ